MNREKVDVSVSEGGEELHEPDSVRPIADLDDDYTAMTAGFAYQGEEYGHNAWITANTEDLMDIRH